MARIFNAIDNFEKGYKSERFDDRIVQNRIILIGYLHAAETFMISPCRCSFEFDERT